MSIVANRSEDILKFDPDRFLIVPPHKFEDPRVGEIFRASSRTLTDSHAAAFQTVSADNHLVHYDVEWAKKHRHSAPVVDGLQVLAFSAPGAILFPPKIDKSPRRISKPRTSGNALWTVGDS